MGIPEAMIVNVQHSVAATIINVFCKKRPHSSVYHLFGITRLRPSKLELSFPHVASMLVFLTGT